MGMKIQTLFLYVKVEATVVEMMIVLREVLY